MFPMLNKIFKFIFSKKRIYREKATSLKSRMKKKKNGIEKSSFFNEISLKYKETKLQ